MIKKLHIENYILINSLDIELEEGLNTITGETGAGKSILLGAINLILGGRGDVSLIRNGAKNLVLEGEFATDKLEKELIPLFEEYDLDYEHMLTIRRIITSSGKSKSYLNDEPITQAFLKELAPYLVDIHSQHQTILLSHNSFQTKLLDSVAQNNTTLTEYAELYADYCKAKREIEELKLKCEASRRDFDFISFQLEQLVAANLQVGEKETLEVERNILSNASLIGETLYTITSTLTESDTSVIPALQNINSNINKIEQYLPEELELSSRISSVLEELKDINRECDTLGGNIENDPARLVFIEERIDTLNTLEHKHKVETTDELITIRESLNERLNMIENEDDVLLEMTQKLSVKETETWLKAKELHAKRCEVSGTLSQEIVGCLASLGMPNAHFTIDIQEQSKLTETGCSKISFLFSANNGAQLEPIDKVASGGEMSRLMLSLKVIASVGGTLPTIIFDEIDTGVSGKVADMMGNLIEKLSCNMQIINITHLPQIASKGKHHFYVYKEHSNTESYSHIVKLNHEQRVHEIAVMLSGNEITDEAKKQAERLLKGN